MISIEQELNTMNFLDHSWEGGGFVNNSNGVFFLFPSSVSINIFFYIIFLNSVDEAAGLIFHSYGRYINGFGAVLEEEHAKQIASQPSSCINFI